MDEDIQTSLRQGAGIVAQQMSQAFNETEEFNFNIKLEGELAKRVAALCKMMEVAYGTSKEMVCEYIVSVGVQNIRQGTEQIQE
jgi:hypothetical protein